MTRKRSHFEWAVRRLFRDVRIAHHYSPSQGHLLFIDPEMHVGELRELLDAAALAREIHR